MAKSVDTILVVDIEATCWKGKPPHGQENEIIEVGVCPVDTRKIECGEPYSIMVKPEKSHVSQFCTELTSITEEDLKDAVKLIDGCREIQSKYNSRNNIWASWGDYDRTQFDKECRRKRVNYPFGSRHINIKTLFQLLIIYLWKWECKERVQ